MYHVRRVNDADALALAQAVRHKVFVEEQGVDPAIEYDGRDTDCVHVIALHEGEVVGTGRMLPLDDVLKIGRMAVLPDHRRKGVGGQMLTALLDIAAHTSSYKVVLHAQAHAVAFYARHGFKVTSSEFLEAGIKHVCMEATPKAMSSANEVTQG